MPLTAARVEQVFGKFSWREGSRRGSIVPDPAWVKANIVTVANGWGIVSPAGKPAVIRCHRLIAAKLHAVFDDLFGQGLIGLIKTYDGCFVPRHMSWDPHRSLSRHSWGIAVDVNAMQFPFGNHHSQAGKVLSAFEAHGFEWGGLWSTPDPMHFEMVRP